MSGKIQYNIVCECGQTVGVDADNLIETHETLGTTGPVRKCPSSRLAPLKQKGGSVYAIPTPFEQGKNRKH